MDSRDNKLTEAGTWGGPAIACTSRGEDGMNLRFHWMLPKGGEVAVETAKATAAYRTRCYERSVPCSTARHGRLGAVCTQGRSGRD